MSTSQQGTAPIPERTLPIGKNFEVTIDSPNYPADSPAALSITEEEGKAVARYVVGLTSNPILDEILDITPSAAIGEVQFRFSLNPATPEQIEAGYIQGTYTFSFAPPGSAPKSFKGRLKDPHRSPTDEEADWTAKGTGPIPDETEY